MQARKHTQKTSTKTTTGGTPVHSPPNLTSFSDGSLPQRPFCTLTDFSAKLLQHLLREDVAANVCVSPFGVTVALSMAMAGAGEATTAQMVGVMGAMDCNALYRTCEKISAMLNSAEAHTKVYLGSKMYVSREVPLFPEFKETVAETFIDEVGVLDFKTNPNDASFLINSWAEKASPYDAFLLKSTDVSTHTRVVLVSAIYFRGLWGESFVRTTKSKFYVTPTETVPVDMMECCRGAHYCSSKLLPCDALELSYVCRALSLLVLLPDPGTSLDTLASALNCNDLRKLMKELRSVDRVAVWFPKIRLSQAYKLEGALRAMGMKNIFDAANADLSKMSLEKGLCVDSFIHEALFETGEEGLGEGSPVPVPMTTDIVRFRADRPFIFVLLHHFNHAVVFIGAIRKP
ncbi:unnamed protein product [Ixodes hexagonus]